MEKGKRGVFVSLLDGTFAALPRTWLTSLLLGGVLFIPSSILFGWAYGRLFDLLSHTMGGAGDDPGPLLAAMGLAYLWLLLALLAQGVVFLFVRACVTEQTARSVRGEAAGPLAIASYILRKKYAPLLGQRSLQTAILCITLAAAVLLASLAIVAGVALKSDALAAVLALVLLLVLGLALGLGGIGVAVWLSVRYSVTLESLVVDGSGIEGSIDASMDLVRHRWWRVFGYTLLFGLIVSFASSLVATPIMFFSTIRQFMQALQEVLRNPSGSGGFNGQMLRLMAGMGRKLGILQYVQSLLGGFVTPVFMTLLFLELKKPPEPEPPAQALPGEQGQPPGNLP
jgi:hypothetical protein